VISREELELYEKKHLRSCACLSVDASRHSEVGKHPYRTEFQRDRDRILHSKAFRRLEYKTQVFLTTRGDHLRTRLTHSLEVSQLSRTVASQLRLNADLAEAIALGHDLGHTPFGHAGERELCRLLEEEGHTFKHNLQSVRIVELLEKKYHYDGLRLTTEVKEGLLKHTSLPNTLPEYCRNLYPEIPYSVTLEGQIVTACDEIAQMTHDLDDYLRCNIFDYPALTDHGLFEEVKAFYMRNYRYNLEEKIQEINDVNKKKDLIIRCLVDFLITFLIKHSEELIESEDDIQPRLLKKIYIKFDDYLQRIFSSFKDRMNEIILSNYRIKEMDERGKHIINRIFTRLKECPDDMLEETLKKHRAVAEEERILVVADFISGMTDRFALETYNRIYGL
jgi:dGTPase